MPARSSTSAYQPISPFYGLAGKKNGSFTGRVAIKTSASSTGIKPNMCCAPATNGDRISGLAASQPVSAKGMKGVRMRITFG